MESVIKPEYAIYNGDCVDIMSQLPDDYVDFCIYSPPFASMYTYSSDERDLGNCKNYDEFLVHYEYVVSQVFRLLKPGRLCAVHCMDLPLSGDLGLNDFPGDIIRLHQKIGFRFFDRKNIWKEPLRVAIRTRQRALMHCQLVTDATKCRGALADYLLIFKKRGENKTPVVMPFGLTDYAGDMSLVNRFELRQYKYLKKQFINYADDKTNRLSQWIWRRYASSAWEDIRPNVSLSYDKCRDKEDDRHVCPLQLDIVTRATTLYTNENEIVLSPFMGIGSELYASMMIKRRGLGIELKPSYYNQAAKNLNSVKDDPKYNDGQTELSFDIPQEELPL